MPTAATHTLADRYAIERDMVHVLARMEYNGCRIDLQKIAQLDEHYGQRREQSKVKFFALLGEEINLNSPKQLLEAFKRVGLSPTKRDGRERKPSTEDAALTEIKDKHPSIVELLTYRAYNTLKTRYTEVIPTKIATATGRLHGTFNQTVVVTGRLSSSGGLNLQTLPARDSDYAGKDGKRIRETVVSQPGWVVLAADMSQAELRILAHFSQDAVLLEAYRTGQDLHMRTAELLFADVPEFWVALTQWKAAGCPKDRGHVLDKYRSIAKNTSFAQLYGAGPSKVAEMTGLLIEEAKLINKKYMSSLRGVARWIQQQHEWVQQCGYVSSLFGRAMPVNNWNADDAGLRAGALRDSVNYPIQATNAELIKRAMINTQREIDQLQLHGMIILQVHDEMVMEVPEAELEQTKQIVRKHLIYAPELSVPMDASAGVGVSWAAAK